MVAELHRSCSQQCVEEYRRRDQLGCVALQGAPACRRQPFPLDDLTLFLGQRWLGRGAEAGQEGGKGAMGSRNAGLDEVEEDLGNIHQTRVLYLRTHADT